MYTRHALESLGYIVRMMAVNSLRYRPNVCLLAPAFAFQISFRILYTVDQSVSRASIRPTMNSIRPSSALQSSITPRFDRRATPAMVGDAYPRVFPVLSQPLHYFFFFVFANSHSHT